jgi:hypothetical protein
MKEAVERARIEDQRSDLGGRGPRVGSPSALDARSIGPVDPGLSRRRPLRRHGRAGRHVGRRPGGHGRRAPLAPGQRLSRVLRRARVPGPRSRPLPGWRTHSSGRLAGPSRYLVDDRRGRRSGDTRGRARAGLRTLPPGRCLLEAGTWWDGPRARPGQGGHRAARGHGGGAFGARPGEPIRGSRARGRGGRAGSVPQTGRRGRRTGPLWIPRA